MAELSYRVDYFVDDYQHPEGGEEHVEYFEHDKGRAERRARYLSKKDSVGHTYVIRATRASKDELFEDTGQRVFYEGRISYEEDDYQ